MFLLGGTFRCVVDGVVMSFMGQLVTYHMTRLVTFSVDGLGVFLGVGTVQVSHMFWRAVDGVAVFFLVRLVVFHMARPVTYSEGGLGCTSVLALSSVQVKCMFRCVMGGVFTFNILFA